MLLISEFETKFWSFNAASILLLPLFLIIMTLSAFAATLVLLLMAALPYGSLDYSFVVSCKFFSAFAVMEPLILIFSKLFI